jgi:outer membrane exchange protein TraA
MDQRNSDMTLGTSFRVRSGGWHAAVRASPRRGLHEFALRALLMLPLFGPRAAQAEALLCTGLFLQPLPAVAELTGPAAPLPAALAGDGMCVDWKISSMPKNDFPVERSLFQPAVEAFLTGSGASPYSGYLFFQRPNMCNHQSRAEVQKQFGSDACFPLNDDHTSFALRARGFLAVTPEMTGRPVHFGLFCDDACSLTVHDRTGQAHPVVIRPPALGVPAWRSTNTVSFPAPGLYPIELLYVQVTERANIELSMMVEGIDGGFFCDVEAPVDTPYDPGLPAAGFKILGSDRILLSVEGQWSAGKEQCSSCERGQADSPGNGGCGEGSGLYCNAAAICAPCTSALRCGPQCVACPAGWGCDPAAGACRPPEGGSGLGCSLGGATERPPGSWAFGLMMSGLGIALLRRRSRKGSRSQ